MKAELSEKPVAACCRRMITMVNPGGAVQLAFVSASVSDGVAVTRVTRHGFVSPWAHLAPSFFVLCQNGVEGAPALSSHNSTLSSPMLGRMRLALSCAI